MRQFISAFLVGCAATVMFATASGIALAESKETVIHNFGGSTGKVPYVGPVVDASTGAFYGLAGGGGTNDPGVVYQLLPPTADHSKWTYTIIYNNPANANSTPVIDSIYASNGIVYALGAGAKGASGVFSLAPRKSGVGDWTPTVLYTFTGGSDGGEVEGPLTMDQHGALYATTYSGGTGCRPSGCGTVFKLEPPGTKGKPWTLSVLYRFPGGAAGENPGSGVIFDKQGNLYGSASFDSPSGKSLVFKLTPPAGTGGWTESVLYHFYPSAHCSYGAQLAIDTNGALYGTFSASAYWGYVCDNSANENVFQLAPSKSDPKVWIKTVMRSFSHNTPAGGFGLMTPLTVDDDGNVYGAAQGGGVPGGGTVFVLQPRVGSTGKWNYKTLFNFAIGSGGRPYGGATGTDPVGGFAFDSAGALYGTTSSGGSGGSGVLFRLKL